MSDRRTVACITMARRATRKAHEYALTPKPDAGVAALGLLEGIYWAQLATVATQTHMDVDALDAIDAAIADARGR